MSVAVTEEATREDNGLPILETVVGSDNSTGGGEALDYYQPFLVSRVTGMLEEFYEP